MKHLRLSLILLTALVFVACKNEKKEDNIEVIEEVEVVETKTEESKKIEMTIMLSPISESSVEGEVSLVQDGDNVYLKAMMNGLSEGTHAIHIHEKADCSSADGKSTGGHWNPTAQPHGKWGADTGYHKGDIGNFEVGADGKGIVKMTTTEWCIGCGDETKDILGKAIIVHQGADDFTSQPSGAAGARVSCAGIIQ